MSRDNAYYQFYMNAPVNRDKDFGELLNQVFIFKDETQY